MKKILILACLGVILSGCALLWSENAKPGVKKAIVPDSALAELSLTNFLSALTMGNYALASSYYRDINLGDNYKAEAEKNLFWQNFCEKSKGVCKNFKIISFTVLNETDINFVVQYINADQSVFATKGCTCKGGGLSNFYFTVKNFDNQYFVSNLPPINNLE